MNDAEPDRDGVVGVGGGEHRSADDGAVDASPARARPPQPTVQFDQRPPQPLPLSTVQSRLSGHSSRSLFHLPAECRRSRRRRRPGSPRPALRPRAAVRAGCARLAIKRCLSRERLPQRQLEHLLGPGVNGTCPTASAAKRPWRLGGYLVARSSAPDRTPPPAWPAPPRCRCRSPRSAAASWSPTIAGSDRRCRVMSARTWSAVQPVRAQDLARPAVVRIEQRQQQVLGADVTGRPAVAPRPGAVTTWRASSVNRSNISLSLPFVPGRRASCARPACSLPSASAISCQDQPCRRAFPTWSTSSFSSSRRSATTARRPVRASVLPGRLGQVRRIRHAVNVR